MGLHAYTHVEYEAICDLRTKAISPQLNYKRLSNFVLPHEGEAVVTQSLVCEVVMAYDCCLRFPLWYQT